MKRAGIVRVSRTKNSELGTPLKASAIAGRAGEMMVTARTVVVLPSRIVRLRSVVLEIIEFPTLRIVSCVKRHET